MEVPRLGVKSELQPQQHQIRATPAAHTTACGNAESLTHWARPGIEPIYSGTLRQVPNPLSHNGNSSSQCLYLWHLPQAGHTQHAYLELGIFQANPILSPSLSPLLKPSAILLFPLSVEWQHYPFSHSYHTIFNWPLNPIHFPKKTFLWSIPSSAFLPLYSSLSCTKTVVLQQCLYWKKKKIPGNNSDFYQ